MAVGLTSKFQNAVQYKVKERKRKCLFLLKSRVIWAELPCDSPTLSNDPEDEIFIGQCLQLSQFVIGVLEGKYHCRNCFKLNCHENYLLRGNGEGHEENGKRHCLDH